MAVVDSQIFCSGDATGVILGASVDIFRGDFVVDNAEVIAILSDLIFTKECGFN